MGTMNMNKYDYDLIVIGAGAAGLTASTGAGQLGAKVLLIEKEKELGGDCLHFGCVPSKSLIKSAYAYNVIKNSKKYGLPKIEVPKIDMSEVTKRVQGIKNKILEHDSPEHIKKHYNVETKFGNPSFLDKNFIKLGDDTISARNFIIATGSSPVIPPIEGLDGISYLTNKDIFSMQKLPTSLIILGGGPIGMEMAQAFARLGSKVQVIQSASQLLPKEDEDIAEFVKEKLESEGVNVVLNYRASSVNQDGDKITVYAKNKKTDEEIAIQGDALLVSTGRKANVEELGLENAGIEFTNRGIKVDKRLRTTSKNIYACGDCNGGYQFTHVAGHEGGIAMVNTIMRIPAITDYSFVPWCTYLDPEIASVGLNEKRAKDAGIKYTVHKEELKGNDRALAEDETDGFIKILRKKKGNVIGVQIIGYHAGDLIHEWVAALNGKVSLSKIAQAIHAYPTLSEINKIASGNILAPTLFNNRVRKILRFIFRLQG